MRVTDKPTMKYAIDGSNVLLGVRLNKKPSTRLFACLLSKLKEDGTVFQLFFDNSIETKMAQAGLSSDWIALRDAMTLAGIQPEFASRADPLIERFCRAPGTAVINSTDKMDSWNTRPNQIHRARARRNKQTVRIALMDAYTGKTVLSVAAHAAFEFGGVRFPKLDDRDALVDQLIAPDTEYATAVQEGTLLVLALDASSSMTTTNSFDGRKKSDHLNDVVKSSIERLKNSKRTFADGLYVAVLRFENDATLLPCSSTGAPFSSVNDWFDTLATFDYLKGITPGQTNLRLALQRAKELIQDTVADDDSISSIADQWRAAVVLITDGNHYLTRQDGTTESDADVAPQALDIHQGLSGLIDSRIDVGCVGIGTDVNRALLSSIASECSPIQKRMATNSGIANLLQGSRLFINVDSNDPRFVEAIRAFINVASSRV
jgi:uncharacterized protein YegL